MIAISGDFSAVSRCNAAASLRLPSLAASAAWINASDILVGDRRLDLGKAGEARAGFAGDRQRIERRAQNQPLGLRREIGSDAHLALEAAGKHLALHRLLERRPRGGDPDAAARQFPLDVGHHLAGGPTTKRNRSSTGLHLAGERATALARGGNAGRPAVEFVVLRHCASIVLRLSVTLAARRPGLLRPAASAAGGGASSASVTQPALSRACMIIASASSREISKPSRKPGSRLLSPSLRSVQPVRSSVAQPARSSTVLTPFSPKATSILVVTPGTSLNSSSTPSSTRLASSSAFLLVDIFLGALLQFARSVVVEALDSGKFLLIDQRQLLDRAEAFRGEQLPDDFVEIERLDENLGAALELGVAAFGLLLLGQDVDVPSGQLRGKPHVLPAPADGERELLHPAPPPRCAPCPRRAPPWRLPPAPAR